MSACGRLDIERRIPLSKLPIDPCDRKPARRTVSRSNIEMRHRHSISLTEDPNSTLCQIERTLVTDVFANMTTEQDVPLSFQGQVNPPQPSAETLDRN